MNTYTSIRSKNVFQLRRQFWFAEIEKKKHLHAGSENERNQKKKKKIRPTANLMISSANIFARNNPKQTRCVLNVVRGVNDFTSISNSGRLKNEHLRGFSPFHAHTCNLTDRLAFVISWNLKIVFEVFAAEHSWFIKVFFGWIKILWLLQRQFGRVCQVKQQQQQQN